MLQGIYSLRPLKRLNHCEFVSQGTNHWRIKGTSPVYGYRQSPDEAEQEVERVITRLKGKSTTGNGFTSKNPSDQLFTTGSRTILKWLGPFSGLKKTRHNCRVFHYSLIIPIVFSKQSPREPLLFPSITVAYTFSKKAHRQAYLSIRTALHIQIHPS